MRIVTWNCNQALRKKLGPLLALDPDVAVIQECESSVKPPRGYTFFWHGLNPNKGLGVLSKTTIVPLDHPVRERSAFFCPVYLPELDLRLLATWAFNHRVEQFDPPRSGIALEAIEQLQDWLTNCRSAVVGDFNHNASWDKTLQENKFHEISDRLAVLGLRSAYHLAKQEAFGEELEKTHYWRKGDKTRFHIDYCFLHESLGSASVHVPSFEAWRALSDHVPVVAETR